MGCDVNRILGSVSAISRHFTYGRLTKSVEKLIGNTDFAVKEVGVSRQGRPIHHIRYGNGKTKALFVGYPHPNEPIGGGTCYALLELLRKGHPELLNMDVEWHIVPCIDPDGSVLNEGWSARKFSLKKFVEFYFRQIPAKQVEWSFPVKYQRYQFNEPTPETRVLMGVCDVVKPDFCFSLHNAMIGGAFFYLSHDFGEGVFGDLYQLLKSKRIPLHMGEAEIPFVNSFAPAIYESLTVRKFYDHVAKRSETPEKFINRGAGTYEYIRELNKSAVSFYCELPYLKSPMISSAKGSGVRRGKVLLRNLYEYSYLMKSLSSVWLSTKDLLDEESPFFPGAAQAFENFDLASLNPEPVLQGSEFNDELTEGQLADLDMFTLYHLLNNSHLGRLISDSLKSVASTPGKMRLMAAKGEVDEVYESLLEDLLKRAGRLKLKEVELRTLVQVQLGAGLIVLDAVTKWKQAAVHNDS